jgi:lysophospholipase L1-like esterase
MKRHFSLLALLIVCSFMCCLQAQDSKPRDHQKWAKEIAQFEASDAKALPAPGGILFVGSSSFRLWKIEKSFPNLPVINRGFGGSHLSDSIHFADRIVLKYSPRTVLVYAGDNDLADGVTAEQLSKQFVQFTSIIHAKLPEARIMYVAIKPSLKRWKLYEQQCEANQLIAEQCSKDKRLHYVDIVKPMLGSDGKPRPELFKDDGLHVNDKGYALWASILKPLLEAK